MLPGVWLFSYLTLWVLLLVEGVLLAALTRQVAALYGYWMQRDPAWGLPIGALAPQLPEEDLFGRPVSLGAHRGRKTVLLFASTGCSACRDIMVDVPVLATREDLELVLVLGGGSAAAQRLLVEYRREVNFPDVPVLLDTERVLTEQYAARTVPYAVVIDEDGHVGALGAASLDRIEQFVRGADELRCRRRDDAGEHSLSAGSARAEDSDLETATA